MRLPLPFSGSWTWRARALVYVISWLGPSNVLPLPIAQFVFDLERAGRISSVLEGGKKIIEHELSRPSPTAKQKKINKFHSNLRKRIKKGNIGVFFDELLDQGIVQFQSLGETLTVNQLENGNLQFTLSWVTTQPDFYPVDTEYGEVYMMVQGNGDILVSQTFEVTALDWQAFCIGLANNAMQMANGRLVGGYYIGTTQEKFSRWFQDDTDGAGGSGMANIIANMAVLPSTKKIHVLKHLDSKSLKAKAHAAVHPSLPFVGEMSSPHQIFITYVAIALPLALVLTKVIQKLLEKFHGKKEADRK